MTEAADLDSEPGLMSKCKSGRAVKNSIYANGSVSDGVGIAEPPKHHRAE